MWIVLTRGHGVFGLVLLFEQMRSPMNLLYGILKEILTENNLEVPSSKEKSLSSPIFEGGALIVD